MFAEHARTAAAALAMRSPPLRIGTSGEAHVPINIDESDSDSDEPVVQGNVGTADVVMVNAEQLPPQSPEQEQQQERNDTAVSGHDQDARHPTVQTPPPVSRLHGFVSAPLSVVTTARTGTSPQPLDRSLATSSSPSAATPHSTTTQRRTAAFFKSVHRDILQPSPPPSSSKSALKRPLELEDTRCGRHQPAVPRLGGGGDRVLPPPPIAKRQHVYKSSSDSSDAEDAQTQQIDDDGDEDDEDGDATSGVELVAKPPLPPPSLSSLSGAGKRKRPSESLNFFMRESQKPFTTDLRSPVATTETPVERAPREPIRVCASRTRVCGQVFGRCELRFSDESLELVLWRSGESAKRIWQGTILYKQLERLSYHRGASPPYLVLLELRASEQGQTLFSEFYDSIFAKFAHEQRPVPSPNLFGAAFYFDEELDFVQCTSMAESFDALREFFAVRIADDEALAYFDSEVNASSNDQAQTQASSGIDTRSSTRSNDSVSAFQQATALLRQTQSIAKFFPKVPAAQSTAATSTSAVVEIDDPSQPTIGDDAADAANAIASTEATATTNAAAQKSKTLLTYPFDDSAEASGRISITYGDIARLAPGEFLNDNIIDFYLRFLWRHQYHRDQLYFYSSHFFTQLNGGSGSASLSHDERFARVSRWTIKETDLFAKQFLFIPINDSFHWSIAVFCNPGSAVVRKRRRLRQVVVSKTGEVRARRPISLNASGEPTIVDLVDNFSAFRSTNEQNDDAPGRAKHDDDWVELREEFVDEVLASDEAHRRAHPPCLLFLDSLKCHRKKKFTAMLRAYLEREWQSRNDASDNDSDALALDHETIVSSFDASAIALLEPNIPMQTNSSDCGVFLLMYAAEVARRFPGGVTREDVESAFGASLTAAMFDLEHVQEFREYLHQLVFCLHALQMRGLSEDLVAAEELERFAIEF